MEVESPVACADEIKVLRIDNVELLNPTVEEDRKILLEALAQSTEIATSLPSLMIAIIFSFPTLPFIIAGYDLSFLAAKFIPSLH